MRLGLSLLLAAVPVLGSHAFAQAPSYPKRPVAYVVPYGPGSGNDVIARIVARKITENWGNQIVVVNRPGATGAIGLEMTAHAAPDGHTMVIASTSQIINQHISKVRYDFMRDFAHVSQSGAMAYSIVVLNSFPAKSMKELVAIAKASPGKLNYTGTVGSIAHFMGEMLKSAGGIDIVMISNKLSSESEVDVMAGRIEIWITTMSNAIRFAKADKDVQQRLLAAGVEPISSTPQALAALVKSDFVRWAQVVKETGFRLE